jgi:DNA invertase Pin-like site-specific DNA recombinase
MRAAVYARVSTLDQEPENQLAELRRYTAARQWTASEYVDRGVSGAKDSRPALDTLLRDAKRRRFDVLVVWRLDRLGRNLKHLITLLDELSAIGIGFVSLGEGIDATTPAGRLQMQILGAMAEFERARIAERVRAGMARARANGKHVGRRRLAVSDQEIAAAGHLSLREAADQLGVSKSFLATWRASRRVPEMASANA